MKKTRFFWVVYVGISGTLPFGYTQRWGLIGLAFVEWKLRISTTGATCWLGYRCLVSGLAEKRQCSCCSLGWYCNGNDPHKRPPDCGKWLQINIPNKVTPKSRVINFGLYWGVNITTTILNFGFRLRPFSRMFQELWRREAGEFSIHFLHIGFLTYHYYCLKISAHTIHETCILTYMNGWFLWFSW